MVEVITGRSGHMKPLTQSLSPALLSGSAGGSPLDLQGSDGRLEIQIPAGSLDFSEAQVVSSTIPNALVGPPSPQLTPIPVASPTPPFSWNVTQLYGLFPGAISVLGMYQIQVTDSQGRLVSGVRLQQPVNVLYRYQPDDLARLDLDPGTLWLT